MTWRKVLVAVGIVVFAVAAVLQVVWQPTDVRVRELAEDEYAAGVAVDQRPGRWPRFGAVPTADGAVWRGGFDHGNPWVSAHVYTYRTGIEAAWARVRRAEQVTQLSLVDEYEGVDSDVLPEGRIWCLQQPVDQLCNYWLYVGWSGRSSIVASATEFPATVEEFRDFVESSFVRP